MLFALLCVAPLAAQTPVPDMAIYTDSLQNGWENWSWAGVNLAATSPVHGGTRSISVAADGWEALYFHHAALDATQYVSLTFWLRAGAAGSLPLVVQATTAGNPQTAVSVAPQPATAGWTLYTVTLAALGVANAADFDGFWITNNSGATIPLFYADDITLVGGTTQPPAPITVFVDRGAMRRPVNPELLGVNAFPGDTLNLPYPVVRWGGNSTTRYNWQLDTHNTAMDWFFMNIPDGDGVNNSVDGLIDAVRAYGGRPLITLSTIGWTPKLRRKDWGFSVAKYGAQQATECTETGGASWCTADAGNGLLPGGAPVTGNNPLDTSVAISPAFETAWMAHIAARTGTAGAGGVKYFALDNEPALWSSTHRDVHPQKLGYAELWNYTVAYGAAAKTQDPAVQLFGPVEWGWCAYFWSDADGCGNNGGADYLAHGPLLEWYLRSAREWQRANGRRLLDYLDLHYYPQAPGVALTNDEGTAAARLRSLKSLHDPDYTDESWINEKIAFIPRMRDLIAKNYPGTKFAITEYNFGGVDNAASGPPDDGLSAALAQAETLAIFAREGVDLATRWVMPVAGSRVEDAFRLWLDYDGAGAKIQGDSVRALSSNPDAVGAYAVRGSGSGAALYILLFNKSTSAQPVTLTVSGAAAGSLALYGFDAASRLAAAGSVAPGGGGVFTLTLPARSARLAVGQLAACALPAAPAAFRVAKSGANLAFTWGAQGAILDWTVRETQWPEGDFRTVTGVDASGAGLTAPAPAGNRFYRVVPRNACGSAPEN